MRLMDKVIKLNRKNRNKCFKMSSMTGNENNQDTELRHKPAQEDKSGSRRNEVLTVMMSRILSRLWTLSPGCTSFTTGSVPS